MQILMNRIGAKICVYGWSMGQPSVRSFEKINRNAFTTFELFLMKTTNPKLIVLRNSLLSLIFYRISRILKNYEFKNVRTSCLREGNPPSYRLGVESQLYGQCSRRCTVWQLEAVRRTGRQQQQLRRLSVCLSVCAARWRS